MEPNISKENESNEIKPQEESKPEEQPQETESITKYINQEVSKQLMEMGFSKNVSEKACLFTGSNLESAIEWISEHTNDPDFEEEAKIIKEEQGKPALTQEEIKIKAKELQMKMRKIHLEKQKALDEEQERNRIRITKEMAKAKQLQDEQQMKLFVENEKRRKNEDAMYRKQLEEQMAREKAEKFGKKYDPKAAEKEEKKKYSKEENIQYYLKAIKTLYPPFRSAEVLKNCFATLKAIMSNILKNPNEEKFKKVKLTNPNVHERIGKINLALKVLEELGFVEDGEFLVVKDIDENVFKNIIQYLETELSAIN